MPSKSGFQLQERDIDILRWVYLLRLATVEHLLLVVGRSERTLYTRLRKLSKHGFLYRRRFMLNEHLPLTHQKYIYTVDRKSTLPLVEEGTGDKKEIDLQADRLRRFKPLFARHALMLTDIHVSLVLASHTSSIKLTQWREGKEIEDSVTVFEQGERKKLPVRPDSFFVLEDTRREGNPRVCVFVEADRSTTTDIERFLRKIKAYHAYFEQGIHTERYGVTSARVLTVTRKVGRALSLCERTGEVLPTSERRFYYFAPLSEFSFRDTNPKQAFERIFISPHNMNKRYQLVPPLDK